MATLRSGWRTAWRPSPTPTRPNSSSARRLVWSASRPTPTRRGRRPSRTRRGCCTSGRRPRPGGAGRVDAARLRAPAGSLGAPRAEAPGPAVPRRGAPDQRDHPRHEGERHADDSEAAGADPADPPAAVALWGQRRARAAGHRAAAAAGAVANN